ncbi:MAG: hypothetical protein ETSY1_25980 [Candidatus Entotheonella factor]|uniref:Uncharacterized protein n=1 Tax=Entotheonella factor TaxID=1429438 RepID=W4LFA1_ENTF1|nr:hypothetical protein [Candidatus Entotheonella palauensis]ETW96594.1 MAG: hypothetical protein ETSY1_25980 [Candidatus Entotheonella factor]
MDERKDQKHGEYIWRFEQAGLEQGAYSISDLDGCKIAAILLADRSRPIEKGRNARLLTRDYGAKEWIDRGHFKFKQAMTEGNRHIYTYRVLDEMDLTLKDVTKRGIDKDMTSLAHDLGRLPPDRQAVRIEAFLRKDKASRVIRLAAAARKESAQEGQNQCGNDNPERE